MQFLDRLQGDGVQPTFTRDTVRSPKTFGRFFTAWLRVMWLDIIFMAGLGGAALGIYNAPVAATRNFPITFDASGDIVYPSLAYPERGWIIPSWLSAFLSIVIPITVIILAQFRVRSFWDLNNGIVGLLQSLIIGTLCQVITKQLIGGLRPYFLTVCMPDISLAASHNSTGLNAVGFHEIMYSVDICTQPDKQLLKNAMTSFPSGHATTGAAAFVYLFLYVNAKLKVWSAHRPAFWKLALTVAPLLGAWLKACVLTVDQAHHWYDIVAGGAIGTLSAFAAYRGCYAAVWDSRFNHVPLPRTDEFAYALSVDGKGPRDGVFTRAVGWGKTDVALPRKEPQPMTSARSSATLDPQASSGNNPDMQMRMPPEAARTRYGSVDERVRGDNIV